MVIPNAGALRQFVMCEMHDSPWHGHIGVKKTRKAVEQLYTWLFLIEDVEQYVRTCPCCQHNKSTNQKPANLLQPLPVPTRKWASVSMYLITALPETPEHTEAHGVTPEYTETHGVCTPYKTPQSSRANTTL